MIRSDYSAACRSLRESGRDCIQGSYEAEGRHDPDRCQEALLIKARELADAGETDLDIFIGDSH